MLRITFFLSFRKYVTFATGTKMKNLTVTTNFSVDGCNELLKNERAFIENNSK